MNIDELKMILETINATTGLAKDNESDTRFMRQCRDRLGIGSPGYMLPEEYALTTGMILGLIDKHNEENRK